MKFLVIDDSLIARKIMMKILRDIPDVEISDADNHRDAMTLFSEFAPDLTFLDLTMPEKDGFEILQDMIAVNPEARIIVVSADRQKKSVERVMEYGASAFLPKPPSRESVEEVIRDVMGKDVP